MNIIGQLTIMFPVESVGDLKKQSIVIVDNEKNQLAIDFLGENVNLLKDVTQGMKVDCTYVTRINVTNRVFNRITGKAIKEYIEA